MLPERELQNSPNDRRSFMKLLAAAPVFAAMGTRSLAASVASTVTPKGKKNYSDNIYTKFGVEPIINVHGTWTYMSGSLELPEVREAVEAASHYFVDMFELQSCRRPLSLKDLRGRIRNGHLRRGWRDGLCDRRLHRRDRPKPYLATARYHRLERPSCDDRRPERLR